MKKIVYALMVAGVISTAFFYDTIVVKVDGFVKKTVLEKRQSIIKEEADKIFKTTRKIPENADLGAYLAGILARHNGDFEKTISYMEKSYAFDKESEDIQKELYAFKGLAGDIQSIFDLLGDNFDKKNEFYFSTELKAVRLIKEEKYQEAISLLQPLQKEEPFISAMIAWCYAGLNNKEQAFNSLNQLKEEVPFHQVRRYHQALISAYLGDDSAALYYYNQLQGLTKDISLNFYVSVKDFFEKQNQWNDKNPFYKKYQAIIEKNPLFFDVSTQVGFSPIKTPAEGVSEVLYSWTHSLAQKPDAAVLISNAAIYANPNHVMAKIWSAEVLDAMGLYSFAHKIYDGILKEKPKADIIYYKKGLVHMSEGDAQRALTIFNSLFKRNVSNPVILLLIAQNYEAVGDYKSALSFYERTLFLMERWGIRQTKKVKFQIAQCYLKEKNFKQFEKYAYAALQEDSEDPQILNYLAYEWLERDMNLKEAVVFLEKAHEQAPDSPDILDSLALAYYKQGEHEKALPYAEQAVDAMGASSVANMHLGDIYQALGRVREAQSQYEKALALKFDLTPELEKQLIDRLK